MKLHEKIYTLRTAKNLSQGDLAEILDVSRQSVSKWETGASIPDLDKLIKMSDLFGVSLDALVREEMPENEQKIAENTTKTPENDENPQNIVIVKEPFPTRKIMGFIFFGMAFIAFLVLIFLEHELTWFVSGVLCAFAFICMIAQKHILFYCGSFLYLFLSFFALSNVIEIPLSSNSALVLPIFGVIGFIPMVIWILYEFREFRFSPNRKQKILFFVFWALWILFPFISSWIPYFLLMDLIGLFVFRVGYPAWLGVMLVFTAAWIRTHSEKK